MKRIDFVLRGEHVTLDSLLKATGLAGSGGGAKQVIASGRVQVDGRDELRRTCKIRAGQVVGFAATRIHVAAAVPDDPDVQACATAAPNPGEPDDA